MKMETGSLDRSIQKEKDELADALGYDGSIDILMERAAKEIRRFRALQTKLTPTLGQLLNALHENLDTSSAEEIKDACELIIKVQAMDGGERDTILVAYRNGPLFAGDLPSKTARDSLIADGFMVHVVVKGEDGFNACTHKGAWAYRLLEAGA